MIEALNPTTGEQLQTYDEMDPDEVDKAISEAHDAFDAWRRTDFGHRALLMREAARLLRDRADRYAKLMALEMGKQIGRAHV